MKDNSLISKSFLWMALGLLVTFATGIFVANNDTMLENVYGGMYWVFIVLELVLVFFLSLRVLKMSPTMARLSFLLYSFVSGLTFSSIFVVFNLDSIMLIFLVTAVMFGIMALIGFKTKVDLSRFGSYLFFALIAAIIVSLINIFMHNDMVSLVISVVCVLVFMGITAYDVQKIKELENSGLPKENLAIYGALDLYLDFINIFIHLLQLFADRDN